MVIENEAAIMLAELLPAVDLLSWSRMRITVFKIERKTS